eukprot:1195634-Prorocentrum_minimum.AAC.4
MAWQLLFKKLNCDLPALWSLDGSVVEARRRDNGHFLILETPYTAPRPPTAPPGDPLQDPLWRPQVTPYGAPANLNLCLHSSDGSPLGLGAPPNGLAARETVVTIRTSGRPPPTHAAPDQQGL